ncbi:hypothetical protein HNQ94_001022 [Salirhabdus euzebyi]|uniref:Uncharacterized protein n=1 Tax=Salirhabdus euzebyi TaxID=394506 RepID=A0A841PUA6_9BACI|nr:hypothetical protein [Salirhabdus euzebyi]MBB6452577.1 hypothetical protein [Salirhabdus euzebyi]
MKKVNWFIAIFMFLLILTACSSKDETSTQEITNNDQTETEDEELEDPADNGSEDDSTEEESSLPEELRVSTDPYYFYPEEGYTVSFDYNIVDNEGKVIDAYHNCYCQAVDGYYQSQAGFGDIEDMNMFVTIYREDENGLYRFIPEDNNIIKNWIPEAKNNGSFVPVIKYPITVGETFSDQDKFGDYEMEVLSTSETVETALGTFQNAIKIKETIPSTTTTYYYVKGIGVVKIDAFREVDNENGFEMKAVSYVLTNINKSELEVIEEVETVGPITSEMRQDSIKVYETLFEAFTDMRPLSQEEQQLLTKYEEKYDEKISMRVGIVGEEDKSDVHMYTAVSNMEKAYNRATDSGNFESEVEKFNRESKEASEYLDINFIEVVVTNKD